MARTGGRGGSSRRSTAGLQAQKDSAASQLPGAHEIIAEIMDLLIREGAESDSPEARRVAAVASAGKSHSKQHSSKKGEKQSKGRKEATSYDRSRTESRQDRAKRKAARQRTANGKDPAHQVNDASTARKRADADKASGREPNWNKIAHDRFGPPPDWMKNPHGHHTVYKHGSEAARPHVERSQRILEKYNIDMYTGPENFGWAENRGHSAANAEKVADRLEAADRDHGTREAVSEALIQAGRDTFDSWP